MNEEKIILELPEGIFYNSNMRFCRSIYSLAVGAIGEELSILDAFSASGVRGIRYAKENKNVESTFFLDWSKNCIKFAKKNAKKNKMLGAKFVSSDVISFLINNFYSEKLDFNFIELDPFGTPSPYLYPTFYSMQKKKVFYLSATATDTAVLCGPEAKACMKNYHSRSLNNEFTHENGLRIILKRIAESAAEFNFGITPLFCISDRHYLKVLVKCENSAVKADESMKKLGYITYCSCGWRCSGKRAKENCPMCGKEPDYGGLLWIGETSDLKFVEKMIVLNEKRAYADEKEISVVLGKIKNEIGLPFGYFDLHKTCKRLSIGYVPKIDYVLAGLRKKGFKAFRTHFSDVSVKTDADITDVENAIRSVKK